MKIRSKLIFWFFIFSLFIMLIGYLFVITTQEVLKESIGENSVSLVAQILSEVDRDIYSRIEEFRICSGDLTLQKIIKKSNKEFEKLDDIQSYINEKDREWTAVPKETITPFMQQLIDNELSEELTARILTHFYKKKEGYRVFGEVFVTNKYGANIAQTGKTTDYYQADEEWWQKAKEDGLYVADVQYDESSDVYSIDIGIRIEDENGNFLGVMKFVLNIKEAINTIKESERTTEYGGAEFKLLNNKGKIIYKTGEFEFLEDAPIEELTYMMGDKGYFIGKVGGEKEELHAYAHSKGYKDFKGLDWILLVEYKTEEIFASMIEMRNGVLLLLFILLMINILTDVFVLYLISKPIMRLREGAVKIGEGNLDTRIKVRFNDELGELSSAFNQMAGDLKKSQTKIRKYTFGLEKEVKKRTKQLQSKVDELEKFHGIVVGRELKMVELKKKIEELEKKLKSK